MNTDLERNTQRLCQELQAIEDQHGIDGLLIAVAIVVALSLHEDTTAQAIQLQAERFGLHTYGDMIRAAPMN